MNYFSKIEDTTHCYAADQTNTPNSIYTGLMTAVVSAGSAMWKIPITRLYARASTEVPFHLYYSSGGTLLLVVSCDNYQSDSQNQCSWYIEDTITGDILAEGQTDCYCESNWLDEMYLEIGGSDFDYVEVCFDVPFIPDYYQYERQD